MKQKIKAHVIQFVKDRENQYSAQVINWFLLHWFEQTLHLETIEIENGQIADQTYRANPSWNEKRKLYWEACILQDYLTSLKQSISKLDQACANHYYKEKSQKIMLDFFESFYKVCSKELRELNSRIKVIENAEAQQKRQSKLEAKEQRSQTISRTLRAAVAQSSKGNRTRRTNRYKPEKLLKSKYQTRVKYSSFDRKRKKNSKISQNTKRMPHTFSEPQVSYF